MFERFLEEKKYLVGVSAKTVSAYQSAWIAYKRIVGDALPTKQGLNDFVIGLQKSGVTISTVNSYARAINSYLTWLFKEGHISEPLRLKLLRNQKRIFKPLTDQQLRLILSFKPRTVTERRLHSLLCLALDAGCRIDELITLQRSKLDFDNCLVSVI
jgi:site-specific recombinase XerD